MAYRRIKKNCASCGVEFMASRPSVRFCGKGCDKKGPNSPHWKGNEVSNKVLHKWVERQLGRPKCCSKCGAIGKVDLANISNQYKREVSDWEWLCRKCHMAGDGRLNKFLSYSQTKKIGPKICPICKKEYTPHNSKSIYCSRSCANKSRMSNKKLS